MGIDQGAQVGKLPDHSRLAAAPLLTTFQQANQWTAVARPPPDHFLLAMQGTLDSEMLDRAERLGQRQIPCGAGDRLPCGSCPHGSRPWPHCRCRPTLPGILLPRGRPAIVSGGFGGMVEWGGQMVAHGR